MSMDRETGVFPSTADLLNAELAKAARGFFGGNFQGTLLNDTWAYNSTNNTWFELKPPTSPPARDTHHMVYSDAIGEVVLFGGNGVSGELNDTWTYNFSLNTHSVSSDADDNPVGFSNGRRRNSA